jgi:hypothetical protein
MTDFPLTKFIIRLGTVPRADLARTDTDKAARKYGVRPQDARDYIRFELENGA